MFQLIILGLNQDGIDDMIFSSAFTVGLSRTISSLDRKGFVILSPPPAPILKNWDQKNNPVVSLKGRYLTDVAQITFNLE